MNDILLLTRVELQKLFKCGIVWVGIITLLIIIVGFSIAEYLNVNIYNYSSSNQYDQSSQNDTISWKEREIAYIQYANEDLSNENYNSFEKEQIRRRIAIGQFRIDNNLPKTIDKNTWWYFNDSSFDWSIRVAILILICIGCYNLGSEYNCNTIKQVLLLPYRRDKILYARCLTYLSFGLILYAIIFVFGFVSGLVIYGTEGLNSQVVLYFGYNITTMNLSVYSLLTMLFKLAELLFAVSLIVFLSVSTKHATISIVLGAFLSIMAEPMCNYLATYYRVFYYLPFTNLNFRRYLDFGTVIPSIEATLKSQVVYGLTPTMSLFILVVTIAIFVIVPVSVFKRQDISC